MSILIIVYYTNNPFGAGAAGVAYGLLLFVNGIVFLITALFSSTKGNSPFLIHKIGIFRSYNLLYAKKKGFPIGNPFYHLFLTLKKSLPSFKHDGFEI
jgi:hypothetical protein